MDVHTPAQRSFNMSHIKGKNTQPEEIIKKLLWSNGYRYRLHGKTFQANLTLCFQAGRKLYLLMVVFGICTAADILNGLKQM